MRNNSRKMGNKKKLDIALSLLASPKIRENDNQNLFRIIKQADENIQAVTANNFEDLARRLINYALLLNSLIHTKNHKNKIE